LHTKSIIMHNYIIIKAIKERRETLRITQENLAEMAGVGLRTLKQFESGKGNPTLNTLEKLAEVLGMELIIDIRKPE